MSMEIASSEFQALDRGEPKPRMVRPSLSYWQDAWIRLKANRRALVSLFIVIGLLLFSVAGPWVWRVDPGLQDLDQISQPPGTDRRAIIVEEYTPWDGESLRTDVTGLHLAQPATTQAVRLK